MHRRPMIDYFYHLLLEKIEVLKRIFTITLYDGQLQTSFITARKERLKTTDVTASVLCELSQPMGKKNFAAPLKYVEQTLSHM